MQDTQLDKGTTLVGDSLPRVSTDTQFSGAVLNVLNEATPFPSCPCRRSTRTMYETHRGISVQQAGHSLAALTVFRGEGGREGGENLPREDFSQALPRLRPLARPPFRPRSAVASARPAGGVHLLSAHCLCRLLVIHPVFLVQWAERADERTDGRGGKNELCRKVVRRGGLFALSILATFVITSHPSRAQVSAHVKSLVLFLNANTSDRGRRHVVHDEQGPDLVYLPRL